MQEYLECGKIHQRPVIFINNVSGISALFSNPPGWLVYLITELPIVDNIYYSVGSSFRYSLQCKEGKNDSTTAAQAAAPHPRCLHVTSQRPHDYTRPDLHHPHHMFSLFRMVHQNKMIFICKRPRRCQINTSCCTLS